MKRDAASDCARRAAVEPARSSKTESIEAGGSIRRRAGHPRRFGLQKRPRQSLRQRNLSCPQNRTYMSRFQDSNQQAHTLQEELVEWRVSRKSVVHLRDLYEESGQTLQGSFSAVSKPKFASKYSLESSRRDLHNALLCTALESTGAAL